MDDTEINVSDEEAALFAVLNGNEDEALRIIGEMPSEQRSLLAEYADRLAMLCDYYEAPGEG
jgi:3-deoxy-D-arabino-heptulosonate 7-phosphate (DAHP) synthase